MNWVEPVVLERDGVRLEPLLREHFEPLFTVSELEHFRYWVTLMPIEWSHEEWNEFMEGVLAMPRCVPFCVLHDGAPLGMTTYLDIRPEAMGLEIGMTWLARSVWGTGVNPTMKYLMLAHAFEVLGAIRVQLKTDARNLHSQAAITKLGAVHEGALRQHGIQRTGFIRDTVMFSILDSEWPSVRDRLLARLA